LYQADDANQFGWRYIDLFFTNITYRGDVTRSINLRVSQKLPSGYLRNSAPPEIAYICHFRQPAKNV